MNPLRKKAIKSIPVWALIVILATSSTAIAAYIYISNEIYSVTNVTYPPILLSGNPSPDAAYAGVDSITQVTYTVLQGSSPTGYIHVECTRDISSPFWQASDARVTAIVTPSSGAPFLVSGPGSINADKTIIKFDLSNSGSSINFGGIGGTIEFHYFFVHNGLTGVSAEITSTL
jgi:hypothetical protein